MRTNANAKEVDRENESGGWRVRVRRPFVRLFSTPFATHFRVFRCRAPLPPCRMPLNIN